MGVKFVETLIELVDDRIRMVNRLFSYSNISRRASMKKQANMSQSRIPCVQKRRCIRHLHFSQNTSEVKQPLEGQTLRFTFKIVTCGIFKCRGLGLQPTRKNFMEICAKIFSLCLPRLRNHLCSRSATNKVMTRVKVSLVRCGLNHRFSLSSKISFSSEPQFHGEFSRLRKKSIPRSSSTRVFPLAALDDKVNTSS